MKCSPIVPITKTLDCYSVQEPWDELKRRGCSIENNRLVIIKKDYLD